MSGFKQVMVRERALAGLMLHLAETILKLSCSKSKIIHQPLPSDDPKQRQPNIELAKAKAKLGWQPKVSLKDGLKKTIAYFRGEI